MDELSGLREPQRKHHGIGHQPGDPGVEAVLREGDAEARERIESDEDRKGDDVCTPPATSGSDGEGNPFAKKLVSADSLIDASYQEAALKR